MGILFGSVNTSFGWVGLFVSSALFVELLLSKFYNLLSVLGRLLYGVKSIRGDDIATAHLLERGCGLGGLHTKGGEFNAFFSFNLFI
jgi:hypothetical protein